MGTFLGLVMLSRYILDLWYRWLRPDPDFLGFTVNIATLAALISLLGVESELGTQFIQRLDQRIKQWWQKPWRVLIAVWVGVVFSGMFFHWGYPWLATNCYNPRGVTALDGGRYSEAVQNFRHAVSLSPDDAAAHYNLANTYEILYEYEQAIAFYQEGLELDDSFSPAYNNLSRLYLLARNDPDAALGTLLVGERVLSNNQQDQVNKRVAQAVLRKNIGWAYLQKEQHQAALAELQAVISELKALADPEVNVAIYLAESYRLTALVYSELGQSQKAEQAWSDSRAYALAMYQSEACKNASEGTFRVICLNAQIWAAEAEGQLNFLKGDQ